MHPFSLARRRFLSLTGAAAAAPLLARLGFAEPADDLQRTEFKKLIAGINTFAGNLNNRLTKDEPNSLFFSPFSIEAALAMTAAGARGETLAEMKKTLHLPEDPHPEFGKLIAHLNMDGRDILRPYELRVANAIWAQKDYPWRNEFIDLTRKHYGSGLVEVNFAETEAARKRINDWVEKETREKIKELIPTGVLSAMTKMVLANAIYFKGNWQYQFDKKKTVDSPFTRADLSKVNVPLMHQTGQFAYGQFNMFVNRDGEGVQVLELPYSGRELSMLVFLPDNPEGANRLAQWLGNGNFDQTKLRMQEVKVALPRFKAESKFLLNKPLFDLGMKKAFGPADFTGMSPDGKNLLISHVLHKAFVDVNEEGTEAAAATAVVVARASAANEPVFRADRPFVYLIRDNKSGVALFMGRYSGPEK
jgi:serine protease inhibitor